MKRAAEVEYYRDRAGEWRWRLRAANGKIVADCAEGYKTARGVARGYVATVKAVMTATSFEVKR